MRIVSEAPLTVAVAVLMRAALGAMVGAVVGAMAGVGVGLLEAVDQPQAITSNATASRSVTGKELRRDFICWVLLWY